MRPALTFLAGFAVLLIALHTPYLNLPFHWDEMGQFVPAALDLYQEGALVPHTAEPNVHPPGVMAYLAMVWNITGFSIRASRVAMLLLASVGVLLAFLLAIRLARGTEGAPAFAAVLFLVATPLFYTQSMMVLLDMPAMVMTLLALLLFLDEQYALAAVACVLLVLTKETGLTTPLVFALWLMLREKRWKQALYFTAPGVALGIWLVILHRATGHWLGNEEFARYNAIDSLQPLHVLAVTLRRIWFLFAADGRWLGTIALAVGWRVLRGRDWSVAGWVALAQALVVTAFGGAALDRYLLPVLPILYAAMAASASVLSTRQRLLSQGAMGILLVVGWFWNPPYPEPFENNLAMMDFVQLQREAASFLEANAPEARIASAWPLTQAISDPRYGYVGRKLDAVQAEGLHLTDLADLDLRNVDVLAVYTRLRPVEGSIGDIAALRDFWRRHLDYQPQASMDEVRAGLGFTPLMRWERRGQWMQLYIRGN